MSLKSARVSGLGLLFPLLLCPTARAQFAVIDVASVGQLVQQSQTLAQQLASARAQLLQLQAQYQSMTGSRGMQSLLQGTVRNYMPTQWPQVSALLSGATAGYGALSLDFQGSLQATCKDSAEKDKATAATQTTSPK